MRWWLLAAWMVAPAFAAEKGDVIVDEREPEEVLIFGDRFARWDHTRWYAEMQIGFPSPFRFYGRTNTEFRATALQVRSVLLCEKTWRRGSRQYEVLCDIEDVSLRGVSYEMSNTHVSEVLQELDDDLSKAKVRLYVTDDGRIENVDFENFPANNRREQVRRENARQIFVRLMSSFHMKLPRSSSMHEGQWVEYDSPLFLLPTAQLTEEDLAAMEASGSPAPVRLASMGGSNVLNQLDKYKGQLVVQSVGTATISDGSEDEDSENFYAVKFNGVAIYDPSSGIMTERVYALAGRATASSALALGGSGGGYFHTGRVRMITKDAKIDVGETGRSGPPNGVALHGQIPWVPIE
ncbi:MAG TPA: hypothetical protein PKA64_08595 [Myxococcota bacterium]|nr:hypothetical protein [Myxococcota bacterium]